MNIRKMNDMGMPNEESGRELADRLTKEILSCLGKTFAGVSVLDEIERLILNIVEGKEYFDCSHTGIGKKIFGWDGHDDPVVALYIGVRTHARSSCLNIFCQKINAIIHVNGNKQLVTEIMSLAIIEEMKRRIANNENYDFVGKNEDLLNGIITKRS